MHPYSWEDRNNKCTSPCRASVQSTILIYYSSHLQQPTGVRRRGELRNDRKLGNGCDTWSIVPWFYTIHKNGTVCKEENISQESIHMYSPSLWVWMSKGVPVYWGQVASGWFPLFFIRLTDFPDKDDDSLKLCDTFGEQNGLNKRTYFCWFIWAELLLCKNWEPDMVVGLRLLFLAPLWQLAYQGWLDHSPPWTATLAGSESCS